MASLEEAATAAGAGKGAVLQAGVDQISEAQQFSFTLYRRLVLPIDGFVFYCLATALRDGGAAAYNRRAYDTSNYNAGPQSTSPITPVEAAKYGFLAEGSLHLSQTIEQESDSTIARQRVVFTSEREIREFSDVAPGDLYIMTLPNGTLAAFSSQSMRYDTSDIWHYAGVAVLPYEATQIINDPLKLLSTDAIVSNSLPFWLGMSTGGLPIFPAHLAPMNLVPPYITADIDGTEALAGAPTVDGFSSQSQLCMETVTFILYGCRNAQALDFQRTLLHNSFVDGYGVMNLPAPIDLQKPQPEFGIIAQKKRIVLEVNYYQQCSRDLARKLISEAFITIIPEGY